MKNNEIFWKNIYCKEDLLYTINDIRELDNQIQRNVEMIVFQEMYNIIDDVYEYLKKLDVIPLEFSESEIEYINYRINNLKSPLFKSIYSFFKHLSTKNDCDLNSTIRYIDNKFEYIFSSLKFESDIEKYTFVSNVFIPYLIFLHEYVLYKNPSSAKRFNKIFKDLLHEKLNCDDSINLIDSLFHRKNVGGELIQDILSNLEKESDDKRAYIENLKLCKYICKKQGNTSGETKYNKLIADEYMKISEGKDGFIKNKLIKEAIKYDSSNEIYYQENRSNIKLNSITIKNELSWNIFMPYCIESFDFYKLIDIITNLTLHFKTETGDPLIDNCTINYIDENNNITGEKGNPALLDTQKEIFYHAELIWHLLHYGHLYHQEISNYLNKSWFDKDILDSIEYPLKIIFDENKSYLEIKCAISILIPQFEKIFRKLAIKKGIVNQESNIEKLRMSELIKRDEIRNCFDEKIYDFINYVFFNFNLGLNLRNKFLHSTTDAIFTENNLNILFICLIKLSKIYM